MPVSLAGVLPPHLVAPPVALAVNPVAFPIPFAAFVAVVAKPCAVVIAVLKILFVRFFAVATICEGSAAV